MGSGKTKHEGLFRVLGCCLSAYLEHSVWSFQKEMSHGNEYVVFQYSFSSAGIT